MTGLFSFNSPLWRFVDRILHLMWLNLLWLVCSLPVVTMGAATTALYSVTLKYAGNREGYLTREYFRAFIGNFWQSTLIFLLLSAAGIFLGMDFIVYARSSMSDILSFILLFAFFTCLLLFAFMNLYVYAIIAKFRTTVPHCLKNAFIMSICHWPCSVLMIAAALAILAVGFLLFPPVLFVGSALYCYLCSKFFVRIFSRYIPGDDCR